MKQFFTQESLIEESVIALEMQPYMTSPELTHQDRKIVRLLYLVATCSP
jgi:hypothetical protein